MTASCLTSDEKSTSAKAHRRLPDKRQQQEKERDDGEDVHQGSECLVGLGQLGEGGVEGESGQQRESHERGGCGGRWALRP